MTPEQLLIPRYKVIESYPKSPFKIGDILYKYEFEDTYNYCYSTNPDILLQGTTGDKRDVENFPKIFKKMSWWEDRNPEDLPKYLKENDTGLIVKPTEYFIDGNLAAYYTGVKEKKGKWKGAETPFNLNATIPVSHEDMILSLGW